MLFPTFVSILSMIIKKPKEAFIIILLCVSISLGYMYHKKEKEADYLKLKNVDLSEKLSSKVSIKDGEITIIGRDANGNPVGLLFEAPAEGGIDILDPKDGEDVDRLRGLDRFTHRDYEVPGTSGTIVRVKIAGLCFKPGFGAFYDTKGLKGAIDVKIVFWKRFSAILWASTKYGGAAISRHIDDFFPKKITPKNVEVTLFGGIEYKNPENKQLFLGFRSNF